MARRVSHSSESRSNVSLASSRELRSIKRLADGPQGDRQAGMSWTAATTANRELNLRQAAGLTACGIIAFHLAYSFSAWSFLIAIYLYSLAAGAATAKP